MRRARSKPQSNGEILPKASKPPSEAAKPASGLFLKGCVDRRWRKLMENGSEIVYYEIAGQTMQVFSPNGHYFAIGELVELLVRVSTFTTKGGGVRHNLVAFSQAREGEF